MKQTKIKIYIILIIITILFSACNSLTSGGDHTDTTVDIDTTGYGLEISFSLDDEYLKTRRLLQYELDLKNSGLEPVTLEIDNFKLITGSVSKSDFTQETINDFYEKIIGTNEITLHHDMEKTTKGMLEIDKNYYDNPINEDIKYTLEINYDYKTSFVENLEIDDDSGIHYIKKGGNSISQAAPIQITQIKLIPDSKTNQYLLEYYIENKGKSNLLDSKKISINLKNIEINFRNNQINLENSCTKRLKKELTSSTNNQDTIKLENLAIPQEGLLIISCKVEITEKDLFTTQTNGKFEYTYRTQISNSIRLPTRN